MTSPLYISVADLRGVPATRDDVNFTIYIINIQLEDVGDLWTHILGVPYLDFLYPPVINIDCMPKCSCDTSYAKFQCYFHLFIQIYSKKFPQSSAHIGFFTVSLQRNNTSRDDSHHDVIHIVRSLVS